MSVRHQEGDAVIATQEEAWFSMIKGSTLSGEDGSRFRTCAPETMTLAEDGVAVYRYHECRTRGPIPRQAGRS